MEPFGASFQQAWPKEPRNDLKRFIIVTVVPGKLIIIWKCKVSVPFVTQCPNFEARPNRLISHSHCVCASPVIHDHQVIHTDIRRGEPTILRSFKYVGEPLFNFVKKNEKPVSPEGSHICKYRLICWKLLKEIIQIIACSTIPVPIVFRSRRTKHAHVQTQPKKENQFLRSNRKSLPPPTGFFQPSIRLLFAAILLKISSSRNHLKIQKGVRSFCFLVLCSLDAIRAYTLKIRVGEEQASEWRCEMVASCHCH